MLVKDLMKTRIITVLPGESIEIAAREMARFGISCLLVKEGPRIVGMITERDLLTRVIASGRDPKGLCVGDVMTTRLISVCPSASIDEASSLMMENRIKKLPVSDPVHPDDVLGIISLTDIAGHKPQVITQYVNAKEQRPEIYDLLAQDESQRLEFKSSLRFNSVKGCLEPKLEFNCLKTICAFLNSEGGDLLIGVNDSKWVVGLKDDYMTLPKYNRDSFENYLTNQISNKMGDRHLAQIKIDFPKPHGKEMCRVNVAPSPEPAFLRHKGRQYFFVRTGNASRPFNISDSTKYMLDRWPDVMVSYSATPV